jgi:hypothetical protein
VQLRMLAEQSGATFLHRDGGIDDRSGLLASLVARADRIFFPVDCVSHNAVAAVKRGARHLGKPCVPLRLVLRWKPRLLSDVRYRHALLAHCRHPFVRAFWQNEFAQYTERFAIEAIAPIQNKVGTLLSPPVLRSILGQTKSTIDVRSIMDRRQVLIVNLSKGKLGEAPTHLLGAFLATAFAQAAESRANISEHQRVDFTLYADEFQHFATDSFATILSEARKYRLALVLAHQFLVGIRRAQHAL